MREIQVLETDKIDADIDIGTDTDMRVKSDPLLTNWRFFQLRIYGETVFPQKSKTALPRSGESTNA